MTKPADMTAAPVEVNGVKFYPLTLSDWGELDRWMQKDIMDEAIDTSRRNQLTGEILRVTISEAQSLAARTSTATPEGFSKLNTFGGFMKLIEVSSKGEFGKAAMEAMNESEFTSMVEELGSMIMAISQPEVDEGEEGGESPKKK